MNKPLKYISRIRDEFDTVICGVNGVLLRGSQVDEAAVDALIRLYQDGKQIALASNTGMRVRDLFYFLKQRGVPMRIFYAMVTAGELAHFYLKHNASLGNSYYALSENAVNVAAGLDYRRADSVVLADFILAETTVDGVDIERVRPVLEEALTLKLPFLCVGNNTSVVTENGVTAGIGAVAEQYAMMGGKIIPLGKPDVRIASYLVEGTAFKSGKCLVIGDSMATDIRMGNHFKAQTLLITDGVHQIKKTSTSQVEELSRSYGLNVDYCMEALRW